MENQNPSYFNRTSITILILGFTPIIIRYVFDLFSVYAFTLTGMFSYVIYLSLKSKNTEELQLKMEESAARLTIYLLIVISGLVGSIFLLVGEISENDPLFFFGILLFGLFSVLLFGFGASFILVKRFYDEDNKDKIGILFSLIVIILISYMIFNVTLSSVV